jgi:uncharacterized protein YfaS (alpha-2-macroglobulin family)
LLLDTHAFLWFVTDDPQLSAKAKALIGDPNNEILVSVRAEIPGRYSALPTTAAAMYAPELRGNSDEIKLSIVDR